MNVSVAVIGYECPSEKWSLLVFSGRYCPGNFTGILAGTMERVLPGVYLDGAHNAGGIEALHETMTRMQKRDGKIHFHLIRCSGR